MAESISEPGNGETACFFDEPFEKIQVDKEMRKIAEIINSCFFMMSILSVLNL